MELTRVEDPQVWFAPDVQDNRSKPEAERFAVLIKPLTRQEMVAAKRDPVSKLQAESKDAAAMLENWDTVRDAVLGAAVLDVRNLHVKRIKDGTETIDEVRDAAGIIATGHDSVINAVYVAIEDHSVLAEGVLGKSVSQSDCSAPLNQASGAGAAGNVAEPKTAKFPSSNGNGREDAKTTSPTSTSTLPPSSPAALGPY